MRAAGARRVIPCRPRGSRSAGGVALPEAARAGDAAGDEGEHHRRQAAAGRQQQGDAPSAADLPAALLRQAGAAFGRAGAPVIIGEALKLQLDAADGGGGAFMGGAIVRQPPLGEGARLGLADPPGKARGQAPGSSPRAGPGFNPRTGLGCHRRRGRARSHCTSCCRAAGRRNRRRRGPRIESGAGAAEPGMQLQHIEIAPRRQHAPAEW
jgi:hypothetical protein